VFVKTAKGQEYTGGGWPGTVVFTDFLHPDANQYWGDMLNLLYNQVQFSGVWLDMNEYANFCNAICNHTKT
jgi:alpha-glucosidase (family GH31 glycosyl hydrolase)